jgi:hypothetical protein
MLPVKALCKFLVPMSAVLHHRIQDSQLHDSGLHQYPGGMLSRIMVGQSAAAANVQWLQGLLGANSLAILVYRVGLCAETFDLDGNPSDNTASGSIADTPSNSSLWLHPRVGRCASHNPMILL